MRRPTNVQLASIAAASVLVGAIAAIAAMHPNSSPKALDLPPMLLAEGAQVDYFLKVEGIDGESANEKHKGEIEILSYSFGASNAGSMATGGGGGAGKVSMGSVRIVSSVSKASPMLFEYVATGKHIPSTTLTLENADTRGGQYMQITLTDVFITSYQHSGDTGNVPLESYKLNFSKIEFEYTPQNPDGTMGETVRTGYDVAANKKV
jgi:type VI secretion system secreted protein Hcp